MLERSHLKGANAALRNYPAVVVLGSRQVGKTTLAKHLAAGRGKGWAYLDLESPRDVARLTDAESYLEAQRGKLVVIDEVQRMPELFPVLRAVIDRDRKAGRFLLLGSSSPEVVRRSSESLAGRVAYLELMPLHVGETGIDQMNKLWLRGGYPEVFLARNNAVAFDGGAPVMVPPGTYTREQLEAKVEVPKMVEVPKVETPKVEPESGPRLLTEAIRPGTTELAGGKVEVASQAGWERRTVVGGGGPDSLVPGGVLIIDDYGHWSGSKKAVDEFIEKRKLNIFLNRIDYTGRLAIKM